MNRDITLRQHILDAIVRIREYKRDGKAAFVHDTMIQDATIRNLEVIGEAVKGVSQSFTESNPKVPSRAVAGMRDTLIHRYFAVNLELVWAVVEQHLESLRLAIEFDRPSANDSESESKERR